MTRTHNHDTHTLDDLLASHKAPPPDEMRESLERVAVRLRSEAAEPRAWPALASREPDEPVVSSRARWLPAIAAAAVLTAAVGTAIVWHSPGNALFRVSEGNVHENGDTIRSNGGGGAVLALTDGSRVEMRSNTELALEHADDGVRIRLHTGGIIVNAARQREGHLYVQTKDVTVSVVGTVFFVNAEEQGSRVAVLEGEVHVQQGTTEKTLLPGEQVATSPAMASPPIAEGIAWSRDAGALVGLLQQATVEAPAPERQTPRDVIQPDSTPKWEVVSIRPCENTGGGGGRGGGGGGAPVPRDQFDPERMVLGCKNVWSLVASAYVEYANGQANPLAMSIANWTNYIEGLPAWSSDRYTIEAKAEKAVDRGVMRGPMLRALLEDRFQLKIRREDREIPLLALTVARSGAKLKPNDGSCNVASFEERAAFPAGTPFCVRIVGRGRGATPVLGVTVMEGLTMEELIASTMMGTVAGTKKPIIDKTGITGKFDFTFEHALPPANIRIQAQQTGRPESDFPTSPTIVEAIEKQFGLTLVETKGPWPHFVIEHMERPSPN